MAVASIGDPAQRPRCAGRVLRRCQTHVGAGPSAVEAGPVTDLDLGSEPGQRPRKQPSRSTTGVKSLSAAIAAIAASASPDAAAAWQTRHPREEPMRRCTSSPVCSSIAAATVPRACTSSPTLVRSVNTGVSLKYVVWRAGNFRPATHGLCDREASAQYPIASSHLTAVRRYRF